MVARCVLVRTFFGTSATLLSLAFVYAETQSVKISVQPAAMTASTTSDEHPDGKELFNREWLPNDPRSHGGDGLGPVFNDSSCVACHNQGGSGGGGPASKNIDIITAFVNPVQQMQQAGQQNTVHSVPGFIISTFARAMVSNRGITTLSQPSHNTDFTINITSESQSQTDTPEQSPPTDGSVASSQPSQTPASSNAETQPAQNAPSATVTTTASAPNSSTVATAATSATSNNATTEIKPADKLAEIRKQKAELAKIHPAFASARSVVLHRFSTNDKYEAWRNKLFGLTGFDDSFGAILPNRPAVEVNATIQSGPLATASTNDQATSSAEIQVVSDVSSEQQMQQLKMQAQMGQIKGLRGQQGNFAFVHSPRNPTALFGAGLIDQIPDRVLLEQAQRQFKEFPEIQGRVAKMKDGKIGRFGWKDQKASLYEFAMTACAVELGLDVPDQPQSGSPLDPKYKPKGHDMDQAECDGLVAYLRNLPAPIQHKAASSQEAEMLSAGEKHFAAVGCANCHVKQLGTVSGIYGDLLLHDMGQDLGDSGDYNVFVPDTPEEQQADDPVPSLVQQSQLRNDPNGNARNNPPTKAEREKTIGAMRQEWRTPPLWGVRDSGSYLHDGRAETLEQAIAFHGGEAASSAKRFFMLKPDERAKLIAFLKSLIAPDQDQLALAK